MMRIAASVVLLLVMAGCARGPAGADGADGLTGTPGPQGPGGSPGDPGQSVSFLSDGDLDGAEDWIEVAGGTDPADPLSVPLDTNLNGVFDFFSGPQGPSGANGLAGLNGSNGMNGMDGAPGSSVTSLALLAGDPDCPAGGSKFTSVSGPTFACNGAQGLQGTQGDPGPNLVSASTTFGTGVVPVSALVTSGLDADSVDGMHASGGTVSTTDLKALIAKTACGGRAGRWTDGAGCSEYVTIGCFNCNFATAGASCTAGRHACTITDLLFSGFRSIDAQGLRSSPPSGYLWGRGFPGATENQIFYPWGLGGFSCSAGSAPMFSAGGGASTGAMGCYSDSYTGAWGPCCLD